MDVSLSETQQLVRDSIRDYLEREVPFDRVREVEATGDYDRRLWEALVEQGWLALPFAEELGGQGGELADVGVLLEELQRRSVLIPILETVASGVTIARHADAATAKDIVSDIVSGALTISPAILEANDSYDDIRMQVASGTVSGEKYFVDYGQYVTHHLVVANDGGELGVYLVDANGPQVQVRPLSNTGRVPQANITYTGAPAQRIASADAAKFLVQLGRALATIQCLACAQQALDMTITYVGMRVQFGRPLGSFQAVQHLCADMASDTLATRFLAYEALWMLDRGMATDTQLYIAKAQASRTASERTMDAHQLHGGLGFTREYDLHFSTIRGKQAALSWGTESECLAKVAATVEEPEKWL